MTIGSWWLAKHQSLDGETVEFSVLANRTQSSNRAVGGKLFATNRRVLFSPHLLDYALGGKMLQIPIANITQISRRGAGGDTFGGGLRDRLVIAHDGENELFVISDLDMAVAQLQTHLQTYAQPSRR